MPIGCGEAFGASHQQSLDLSHFSFQLISLHRIASLVTSSQSISFHLISLQLCVNFVFSCHLSFCHITVSFILSSIFLLDLTSCHLSSSHLTRANLISVYFMSPHLLRNQFAFFSSALALCMLIPCFFISCQNILSFIFSHTCQSISFPSHQDTAAAFPSGQENSSANIHTHIYIYII